MNVAKTTPQIPNFHTNTNDKIKLITVSAIAHFFVSLNNPAALTYVVIGIFIIKPNKYNEKAAPINIFV